MIISAKLHSNSGYNFVIYDCYIFPRVQIVFYKLEKTERYFYKQLNLLLTFAGILDTGIYLIRYILHTYTNPMHTNDVFNGNYCVTVSKSKNKLTVLLQYFFITCI
jgi:hypothetical protein